VAVEVTGANVFLSVIRESATLLSLAHVGGTCLTLSLVNRN
jgi:hypothetical protein